MVAAALRLRRKDMIPELPSDLHTTRDLLKGSLRTHPADQASSMPEELLEDLVSRFQTTSSAVTQTPSLSWFAKIQLFISRPAFGVAALAVVILGLALPGMMAPTPPGSGFRGAINSTPAEAIRIILVQAPSTVAQQLEQSGDFEKGAISSISQLDNSLTGPRVLVDFQKSEISVINANGEVTHTAAIPADARDLSSAVAAAVSRL